MGQVVLVTGAAGFIGAFLCKRLLLSTKDLIVGIDNLNDYYDVGIKQDRLKMLRDCDGGSGRFIFVKGDLVDDSAIKAMFDTYHPDIVVNLAAQAGVRYSIDHPRTYIDSNIVGFFNILEACRHYSIRHLVFASSSSVYGMSDRLPYSIHDRADSPVSLYAATKRSDELIAHAYAKLYDIPSTGLRFFTVYGPMGRPDMAYFKFTNKIVRGEPIQLYNMGDMWRDFTYIDDIVTGIVKVMDRVPVLTKVGIRYKIYNIGNNHPELLERFVSILEHILIEEGVVNKSTDHELLPMQPGDVYQTYADIADLERDFGFRPSTSLEVGLRNFVRWYKKYYGL